MALAAQRTGPAGERTPDNVVALRPLPRSADGELLAGIRRGEAPAFRELMQRHLNSVLATARRIVGDAAEAEDIAQEAFLRLWRGADGVEAIGDTLLPWLRRVASNLAIDRLRKARRLDVTDELPDQPDQARQLQTLETRDTAARVEAALASLPERQRLAVGLFHFEELSQREVAQAMEISEDALESLLARGRRKLREILKDDWRELLDDGGSPA